MTWIRLRQVALVVHDLDRVVESLHRAFGLRVAYRDPAVAAFGLENAVMPVGTQFIEVVSPTREGTAGGRQLERLGGDGGYMVICHTDDHPRIRARVSEVGARVAFEADDHGYRVMQLHPGDTGGSFLEIDYQPGGDDPHGQWAPAGPAWEGAVCTDVVDGIVGVTVASTSPTETAVRWSEILAAPVAAADASGSLTIAVDNAFVSFVPGAVDSLVGTTVSCRRPFAERMIGGVLFSPAPDRG